MAGNEEKRGDLYAVLGLKKECSTADLRNAYKKLALKWHPDRCTASGNSKFVEEAKEKFQDIQEAYSVLSDANKRFLYDVGAYDSDDDDNGMGDFLGEMAAMMSQSKPNKSGEDGLEELQELFDEMFQRGMDSYASASQNTANFYCNFSSFTNASGSTTSNSNKRNCDDMSSGTANKVEAATSSDDLFYGLEAGMDFCFGVEAAEEDSRGRGSGRGSSSGGGRRRNGRKQKVSSKHDVSSRDAKIST